MILRTCAASAALFASALSLAQGSKGEWVLSNALGTARTRTSDVRVRQPSSDTDLVYRGVRWSDEWDESPPLYSLRAIHWSSPEATVGYGFEFVHLKALADPDQTVRVSGTLNGSAYSETEPIRNTMQRFTVTNGLNLFHAVAVGRRAWGRDRSFPAGRNLAYAGVGAGFAMPHPVTEFLGGPTTGGYENGGFSWHAMAGFERRLDRRFGLALEVKYVDYRARLGMDDGATGSTRLKSVSYWLGTTYRL